MAPRFLAAVLSRPACCRRRWTCGLSEERSARPVCLQEFVEFDILPDELRDSLAKRETLGSVQVRRFVIDERDHGRLLRHVQGVLLQTQTFERVDVRGGRSVESLRFFMSSRETNSAYMLMYTYCFGISWLFRGNALSTRRLISLNGNTARPPRFREPRCAHLRVVLVEEGVYLLVTFLNTLLSGLVAVVVRFPGTRHKASKGGYSRRTMRTVSRSLTIVLS